jgi:hypothetical protein
VFPILSLLYPGIDVRNEFHTDHVFPKSLFTRAKLTGAGFDGPATELAIDRVNRLPNLQLLEGSVNIAKRATLPLTWATGHYPSQQALGLYLAGHDLVGLPASVLDFPTFYETREGEIRDRLAKLLGVSAVTEPELEVPVELVPLDASDEAA